MTRKFSRLAASAAGLTVVLGLAVPLVSAGPALASVANACPAIASAGETTCSLIVSTETTSSPSTGSYGPAQIASAYGLDGVSQNVNSSGTNYGLEGDLQTVAVIGAGDDPTVADDLANYRAHYGLNPCTETDGCLRVVNEEGASSPLPAQDPGFQQSESDQVELVSAACPNCRLLVVEASGNDMADIAASVNEAAALGATIINEPITGDEVANEASLYDSDFDHPGVEITVPSGNLEAGQPGFAYAGGTAAIQYPAASPYVTAVGGTNLDQSGSSSACTSSEAGARGWCEEAWLPTVSGCSQYEPKPVWQDGITACSGRADSDVSAVASSTALPGNPMAIEYGCTVASGCTDWMTTGGTGAASAIVAGIYADAGPPATATSCAPATSAAGCPAAYPYDNPGGSYTTPGNAYPYFAGLNDITADAAGTAESSACTGTVTSLCTAGAGWDGVSGVGTPQGVTSFAATGTETGWFDAWEENGCIDNNSGKVTNGNEIDNAPCDDFGNHQDWTMLGNGQIELGTTGDCIGVSGGNTASGSKAVLWSCSGVPSNQQWRVTGWGELQEENSGKCLDQPTVTSPVPPLEIEPCSTDGAYSYVTPFDLPATTGEITLQGASGQCLTIESIPNPQQVGAKIATVGAAGCSGNTSTQEWTLESNGNIQLEGSNTCVSAAEIPDENPAEYTGAPQTCWTSSSEGMQQWIIESDGELFLNGSTLSGDSLATQAGEDRSSFTSNGDGSDWNFP